MTWFILGAISLVLLVIYRNNRNAVWGGLAGGLFIGLIIAVFFYFKGTGLYTKENIFDWHIIVRWAITGTIFGFAIELLAITSKKLFKK